jgi:glycolate oxidase iron-sulfur subunit
VPFGELLEATRGQLARRGVRAPATAHRMQRLALEIFPRPERLGPLMAAARLYQRSGLRRLVRSLGVLERFKGLAAMEALLPELPARAVRLPEVIPARGKTRGRAGLVIGCVQRYVYPDVNRDTARLLAATGYEVVAPRAQGCCGALHLHAGRLDEFRTMARALMRSFDPELDVIVVNAAGCGSALKEYGRWLSDPEAEAFGRKVRDISEVLAAEPLPLGEQRATVAYHDPCHLAHGQRLRSEPRELLRRIPGLALREIADGELCCGSAGLYNLLEPEIAGELGRRKAERIRETGASIVASGNPGCLMHIDRYCRAMGMPVELVHPVTLLARALREP